MEGLSNFTINHPSLIILLQNPSHSLYVLSWMLIRWSKLKFARFAQKGWFAYDMFPKAMSILVLLQSTSWYPTCKSLHSGLVNCKNVNYSRGVWMDPVPLKLFHLPQRHVEAVAPFNQHPTAAQWKERCACLAQKHDVPPVCFGPFLDQSGG